jgi:hypothetical protein
MFMDGRIEVLFMEIMFTTSTVTKLGKPRRIKMGNIWALLIICTVLLYLVRVEELFLFYKGKLQLI